MWEDYLEEFNERYFGGLDPSEYRRMYSPDWDEFETDE